MPRGTGMSQTRRRNQKPKASSPEALAALLPNELRSLEGLYTPSDYQALRGQVVDWLDHTAPGQEASDVMKAAGLSAADFYRQALAMPVTVDQWVSPPPPVIETPYEPTQEDLDRRAVHAERLRRSQKKVFVTR